jgi:hypothetical protein
MRWAWLVMLVCGAAAAHGQSLEQWLVVPGKSVGPITIKTTPAKLRLAFPEAQIKDQMLSSGGDAQPEPATVVNGKDPEATLSIFWDKPDDTYSHPAEGAHPKSIQLCYGSGGAGGATAPRTCKWHLANNISFGSSLRELEALNGKEFQLSGFEWDLSGTVVNWKDGALEGVLNNCGRVLLRLQPSYGDKGPTVDQQKAEVQVSGDAAVESGGVFDDGQLFRRAWLRAEEVTMGGPVDIDSAAV